MCNNQWSSVELSSLFKVIYNKKIDDSLFHNSSNYKKDWDEIIFREDTF